MSDISAGALETWAKYSPKTFRAWAFKIVLFLAVWIFPWFVLSWKYAVLYILAVKAISNDISEAVPMIVALVKQELSQQSNPTVSG